MKRNLITKLAALVTSGIVALTVFNAQATVVVNIATDGIGYIHASLNPTDVNSTVLNNMIGYYNGGSQPASTTGLGNQTATYFLDQGSATPSHLNAPLGLNSEVTPTAGQGYGTTTLTFMLTADYDYLIVQWDGPNGGDVFYWIGDLYQGSSLQVNVVNDMPNGMSQYGVSGFWLGTATPTTPVPEASTIAAGATLLLPLGVSIARIIRRKRMA